MKNWNRNILLRNFLVALFLSIGIVNFTSCGDDDELTCAEEISFGFSNSGIQSSRTLPIDEPFGDGQKAFYQIDESPTLNGDSVLVIIVLRARSESEIISVNLELAIENENSCIPLGEYRGNTTNAREGIVFMEYSNVEGLHIPRAVNPDTVIEITECDFENRTISGIFSGTLFLGGLF